LTACRSSFKPIMTFECASSEPFDARRSGSTFRLPFAADLESLEDDKRTMPSALAELQARGIDSPGVFLVIPQNARIQAVAESIILAWAASGPKDWANRVTRIPVL